MPTANEYQKELGQRITSLLGSDFKFYKSKLEIKRKRADGFDVIVLSGSNKYSPDINISFYFGRNFDLARKVEKAMGDYPMPYQIQQYSPNMKSMEGLKYKGKGTWDINIEIPPKDIAEAIASAIEGIAFPFFERFSKLSDARDALANDDSWCFSPRGSFYHMIFKLDAALNDISHFENWSECLDSFCLQQAKADIDKFKEISN